MTSVKMMVSLFCQSHSSPELFVLWLIAIYCISVSRIFKTKSVALAYVDEQSIEQGQSCFVPGIKKFRKPAQLIGFD